MIFDAPNMKHAEKKEKDKAICCFTINITKIKLIVQKITYKSLTG